MDFFISSIAMKSSLEFKFVPNDESDIRTIWCHLFTECQIANEQIDKRKFLIDKRQEKLRNIVKLVEKFQEFVTGFQTIKDCCEELSQNSDVEQIADVKHIEIIEQIADVVSAEGNLVTDIEQVSDTENCVKLKLQKRLMDICERIPVYNPNIHVCRNSEIFESYTEKFDLTNEQKNQIFKKWIPMEFYRGLIKRQSLNINDSDVDRLRNLFWLVTGENVPTYEILKELRIGLKEDIFTFLAVFERTYRAVINNVRSQSMVKTFVNKFRFLDPVTLNIASEKQSLFEAAEILDIARKHERQNAKCLQKRPSVRSTDRANVCMKARKVICPDHTNKNSTNVCMKAKVNCSDHTGQYSTNVCGTAHKRNVANHINYIKQSGKTNSREKTSYDIQRRMHHVMYKPYNIHVMYKPYNIHEIKSSQESKEKEIGIPGNIPVINENKETGIPGNIPVINENKETGIPGNIPVINENKENRQEVSTCDFSTVKQNMFREMNRTDGLNKIIASIFPDKLMKVWREAVTTEIIRSGLGID